VEEVALDLVVEMMMVVAVLIALVASAYSKGINSQSKQVRLTVSSLL